MNDTSQGYVRSFEEEIGSRLRLARERPIDSIDTGANSIRIAGFDWRRELAPGDSLRLVNGSANRDEYAVVSVTLDDGDSVVVLSGGRLAAEAEAEEQGSAVSARKAIEDYFIDLDQEPPANGLPRLRDLIDGFIGETGACTDTEKLRACVDEYGARLLARARALSRADRSRADDWTRALYWARLRLTVALKSHSCCLASPAACEELLGRLETASRGYNLDFTAAPAGALQVLITGFDPYRLWTNVERSNPAASAALALHGTTVMSSGRAAYIETALLPVRYRDFDAGRVEALVDPLLAGPGQVAMIMTVSQNGDARSYKLERFAGRRRGGGADNESVKPVPEQLGDASHAAFYETTLPVAAMVPGPFLRQPDEAQQLFFDQSYRTETAEKLHPYDGDANTNVASVPPPEGELLAGSGGDYLSNEVFYRVAHRREQLASTTLTGHFHIPDAGLAKVGIADVIGAVEGVIKRWLDSLPEVVHKAG